MFYNRNFRLAITVCIFIFTINIYHLNSQLPIIEQKKNELIDEGFDFDIIYKGEYWSLFNSDKHLSNGYLDNFDFITNIDFDKLLGINSTYLTIYFLGNNGFKPNEYLKSRHGISNIAAPNAWKIFSCYLEKTFFNDKFSILFGLYDYNSEFDSKETASLFLNPSHGIGTDIGQTGENGPSIFPTTSLGIRLKAKPTDDMFILATILDGVPGDVNNPKGTHIILNNDDGFFISMEAGFSNFDTDTINNYKFSGGFWYYTDKMDYIFTNIVNWGFYGLFEKVIYKSSQSPFKISGYGRLGFADVFVNPVNFFIAGGLIIEAPFEGREKDKFGIALTSGYELAQDTDSAINSCFETNLEITYLFNITNYLSIQPNFQYVRCPVEHDIKENFIALGARLVMHLF